MNTHIQCNLVRDNQHYTCWLPSKFAKLNKIVRINEEEGWKVVGVGSIALESSYIEERSRDYRTQRRGSDI